MEKKKLRESKYDENGRPINSGFTKIFKSNQINNYSKIEEDIDKSKNYKKPKSFLDKINDDINESDKNYIPGKTKDIPLKYFLLFMIFLFFILSFLFLIQPLYKINLFYFFYIIIIFIVMAFRSIKLK